MEDRLKSGVKEVLTVNIFDTVKKIFVAGSADKGGGPSLEDRMDGFWLDTDMTLVVFPKPFRLPLHMT